MRDRFALTTICVVAALMAVAGPAGASECSTDDTEYTCSGDVIEHDIDATDLDDDVTDIIFEDIESSDDGTYFFDVENTGDEGNSHGDDGDDVNGIAVTFDGSDTEITLQSGADVPAVQLTGEGGAGHSGKDRTKDTESGKGGNGGDGGTVLGTQSITLSDGMISGDAYSGASVIAEGGHGGSGGNGRSYGTPDGEGGDGGDGADGAEASFQMTDGAALDITSTEDGVAGVYVLSSGGYGGGGGKGEGGDNAQGGKGGDGGDAGAAAVVVDSGTSLNITTTGSVAHGVEVLSQGGDGGDGGNGESGLVDASGGNGGTGGSAGDVTVDIEDATIETTGTDSIGVLARSYGGAGGDGGNGDSTFGDGSGGASQGAGPAGNVLLSFGGSITTTGDGDSSDNDGDDDTTTSSAILAQSVGGFAGDAGDAEGLFDAWGASSESAGDAGTVTVELSAGSTITTSGSYSVGIEAQSIGGGGGKGGSGDAISSVGGDGSAGGDGNTVTLTVDTSDSTTISTSGDYSAGISAQSVGGGGGKSGGGTGYVTIGGTGGTGGDGADVTVTLGADVTTTGDYSEGVFVQSIGGGGGVGHTTGGQIDQIGGSGGDGGSSGTVEFVHAGGSISTAGLDSDGVDLQSIGGGGGKGASSSDVGLEVSVVVGSSGGDGGDSGAVSYQDFGDSAYSITTNDDYSSGISAQSGGGGGGNSGSVTNVTASVGIGVSVGASEDAGGGGSGSTVEVDTVADITTAGDHSDGIFAQSYGGGGGNAGQTVSVNAGIDVAEVSVATGGAGGTGGDAAAVTVTSSGTISTSGTQSYGIFAQSSGGGGGKSSNVYSADTFSAASVSVSTGASGGDGGDAAKVTVENSGDVTATDDNSGAIYAQSLGGGGGNSGTTLSFDTATLTGAVSTSVGGDGGDGGSSDDVEVYNYGTLKTSGDNADGLFAQSLAGGGGNSGFTFSGSGLSAGNVAVSVGGSAGDGDASGAVNVINEGSISVSGDNASAIYAESRGGSGGKSGTTMSADEISVGTVDVSVGGEGGDGGTASTVYVYNEGDLSVEGKNGIGIYANSQGGEGGNAGTVYTGSLVTSGAISVGVGAGGGEGGTADDVTVYNYGTISTDEKLSYAIQSQSIGGSGGNGSTVVNFDVFSGVLSDLTDGVGGDIQVSVGGDGGDGGIAGTVYTENDGVLSTNGEKAYGILAQSVGGNGGSGGSVYSFDLDLATESSVNVDVSVGGSGAGGAASDTVTVLNENIILTNGIYAHGILAQSIGGSGGTGGSVTSVGITTTTSYDFGVSVAVGGEGGDGSIGAEVDVNNNGEIAVSGKGADAIKAQSIGGDGGDGGSATTAVLDYTASTGSSGALAVSVAVGGEGGTGNDAGLVTVTNTGEIYTDGTSGRGIYAQSVGGGGGDGGSAEATSLAVVTSLDDYTNLSFEVGVELGGDGGSGGDGGTVEVKNEGTITTTADVGIAILAQSIGGGGGTGGESGSSNSSDSSSSWVDIAETVATDVWDLGVSSYTVYSLYNNASSYFTNWTVSVGGDGGAAGDGGTVTVTNSDTISTQGVDATGIFAQSVGGGGGSGGTGTGASIKTKVEVGGSGAAGGHGDSVTVTNTADITTTGQRGNGIWAQSVGGGGGDAGDVEGAFGAGVDDIFDSNFSIDIGANYDGDSGNGGDGGDVTVSSTDADITTSGQNAVGVWAQSVGGGGGTAGSIALSYYFAGSNGAEGDSGDVTVELDGAAISASGDYSVGIFAQSSSGSYETSDDTSDLDDYFTYDGDASYDAGDITIDLTDGASVAVTGTNSRAVMAASTGYDKTGTVTISVDEDSTISGSDGNAHVISIYDGNANVITNYGTIEDGDFTDTSRDDTIYVIHSDVSDEYYNSSDDTDQGMVTITNYGTISGSLGLYQGPDGSSFANASGGTFNMGTVVDLGSGKGALTNDGTLSPGGVGTVFTSTVSGGSLTFGSDGLYLVDLGLSSMSSDDEADLIVADTVSAVDGTIEINVTSDSDVADGDSGSVYVLVGDEIDADDGLEASDTAIVDYDVTLSYDQDVTVNGTSYSGVDVVELSYSVDVGSSGASVNATNLSSYVSSDSTSTTTASASTSTTSTSTSSAVASTSFVALDTTSTQATSTKTTTSDANVQEGMAMLFSDLLNAQTGDDLNQISASHVVDETGAALFASRRNSQALHNRLRSCPSFSRTDPRAFLQERDCGWVGLVGSRTEYDNEAGGTSFSEQAYGLAAGGQRVMDNGLILGGMVEGEDVSLSGLGFDQDGERYTLGAVLKHQSGPFTYSLSVAYGRQDLSQTRAYDVGGTRHSAGSDILSHVYSADARVTYLQDFDKNYLRWGLGLGLYHTEQNGFTETGTGPLNWAVDGTSATDVVLRPHVEFGRTFGPNNDEGRVFLSVGIAGNLTDPDDTVYGGLVGLAGGGQMAHQFTYDRIAAEIGLGLDFAPREDLRISLRGAGIVSENSQSADLSASLRWLF
ncbi:MAG: hypothetical protein CML68_22925 [Rhodobacteraceae bacterium]|nr:hypothetical protein [Paracoccaceae bacterium]